MIEPNLSFTDGEHLGVIGPKQVPIIVNEKGILGVRGVVQQKATLVDVVEGDLEIGVEGMWRVERQLVIKVGHKSLCVAR